MKISRKSVVTLLAVATSVLLVLASAQAFAASAMTSSLSVSTVTAGEKVDLTTQIPGVSDAGVATQEIIQNIDASKVRLSSASDVIAPEGWTVTYSTDGTNFLAAASISNWATVVKVKATGSVNSGGLSADGKQLYQTSANSPGTVTTPNGVSRSGGDGWDVEFDSRGYVYNWYHHGALNSGLDCRDRYTGLLCEGSWPMPLGASGFHSQVQSTLFYDEVNQHIWLPAADRSTGTGFLCVDVATITTPVLCGGSNATAWKMINARVNAQETGVEQLFESEGRIYTWDILSGKILCYDYLANSGVGQACSNMPAISVTAGAVNSLGSNPTNSMTYFREAFGNVYGQLNYSATCFNATTMEKCAGWATYSQTLAAGHWHGMYLQPDANGQIIGVCTTTNAKCFAANGTTFATNTVIQNAINNGAMGRWMDSMTTVGSKFLVNVIWDRPSYIFCYDFATNAGCANWTPSSFNGIAGLGQKSGSRVYTLNPDPLSSDCIWTNSDNGTPMIGQFSISTGQNGCSITLAGSSFKQDDLNPRLTCDANSGLGYNRFTLSGLTRGTDYTSASLTITKANGDALVSGGTTWNNVAFNAQNYVDLTSILPADLGQNASFKVSYVNKTSTATATGTLLMKSDSAQLCLDLTANVVCPATTLVGTPESSQTSFSATGSTTNAASVTTNYSVSSDGLTIGAPLASQCGFNMIGVVGRGDKASSFPATLVPVPGAVATLLDSSGNVLTGLDGLPITAISQADGTYSFGVIKAGTYKVRFGDFPLVNGVGAGDVAMVYKSNFTYTGGTFTMTGQNPVNFTTIQSPLASPAVTGTEGGGDVTVKASYTMRAVANPDVVSVKSTSMTAISVLANDTPTTSATFNNNSLKICSAGTTTACTLTILTVANQGTYAVSSGNINFTPAAGFTGEADPITYQIADGFSNTPQTVNSTLRVTSVPAPSAVADTLTGSTLAPITVDLTLNDTAAVGATIDKASVKLCASGTTTNCNQTSVLITGKGTYSVNNLGVVTFTPSDGYVGAVPALTYSIQDSVGNTSTNIVTASVTNAPPTLTTAALAPAKLGIQTSYAQTLTQGSGVVPATGAWSVVGSVPAGMTFNVDTGSISGTPSAPGTYQFTVTVTDANGLTSSKLQSITVASPPVITTSPLTYKLYKDVATNIPGSASAGTGTIPATGAWSATGLPAGLSINTATGAISGTPTTTGTFTVTQKVTDSNELFDSEDLTIRVVAKPIITTPNLAGLEVNKAITTITQTKVVGSALLPSTNAWSIVAGTLPIGLSMNPDTGEITGTPTQSGSFPITVRLTDVDGEYSQQVQNISVGVPPVITTSPLTHKLYVGVAGSIPSSATAGSGAIGSSAWTATGLPNGMSIDPATGEITGTPSLAGTFSVIEKVTDANGLFDVETITVNVVAKPAITTVTPLPKLALGVLATPIVQTKTAGTAAIPATGAWSITSGTLPAGLTLNPDTGAISGTPSAAGNFPITLKLTDEAGEFATKDEVVAVIAPPTITTTPLTRSVNLNAPASIANTVTIGSADISVFNGWTAIGLPQGLGINGITGVISGTPTTLGTFQVTVRAEDLNGLSDTEVLTINVVNGPNITTTPTSYKFGVNNDLNFMADDFFAQQFPLSKSRIINNTATQGSAPIKATGGWSATGLPAGLVINPDNGKISGTATTVGEYPVTVTVADTAGNTSSKVLNISIVQGPKNTTARVWNYELDINKRVGINLVTITQTYTLGSAPLSDGRPVPFLVQGEEPSPVLTVSIVDGKISVIPANGQLKGKEKYGSYTLKTLIVDKNGAYDLATFTINLLKPGSNQTTLPLPVGITDGMQMTASTYPLAGTSSAKLPVTYASSTPKVCTVDSAKKTMKMVNEGTCSITASSGTGAKLSKASQSFTITKLPQTVSIVTPGELIPGGLLTAPMPTDDPNGFKLHANASSGLTPTYESLDPNICSIDVNGIVIWDADLTITPRVESDFSCRVKVTQPGDTTYSAAPPQTITLVATHVEPPAPEGGIAKEPAQSASLPATGGTTPLLGGTGFKVIVDSKKKTVTVQPMSKGRWIGPIYADIKISYLPKGSTSPYVQTCKRNYFGIAIYDSKKAMVTPPLGGDNMIVPELPTHKAAVTALIKQYQAMTGKFATTKVVKGKKVVSPGYLDWKPLFGQTTCMLDSKAYAAWKSGIKISATATVTRDRRWPTTYAKYKSYDWKNKSNNGLIFPTVVEWNLTIGK